MTEIPQVKLSHNLCDAHLNVNNAGDVMESPGLHFYKQERKSYDTGTTYGIT